MSESFTNGSEQAKTQGDQRRIHLDSTGMTSSYSNTCQVASTKEEVILNFGLNQSWEQGQQEMRIALTNRIILSPFAAKRLAMLLGTVVQQYEHQHGVLDLSQPSVDTSKPTADRNNGVARTTPQAMK